MLSSVLFLVKYLGRMLKLCTKAVSFTCSLMELLMRNLGVNIYCCKRRTARTVQNVSLAGACWDCLAGQTMRNVCNASTTDYGIFGGKWAPANDEGRFCVLLHPVNVEQGCSERLLLCASPWKNLR